jgi:hypothetical protein
MNKEFEVHKMNSAGLEAMKIIATIYDALLETLKKECPEGREFSIVKTKLEEACFFTKKSIASKPEFLEKVL